MGIQIPALADGKRSQLPQAANLSLPRSRIVWPLRTLFAGRRELSRTCRDPLNAPWTCPSRLPRRRKFEPPGVPGLSGLLTLAVAVVVLAALYVGQEVFLPMVMAILLAFVLAPFVEVLRRWHLGRVPSVIIAVLVALGIIVSLGTIIGFQLAGLATDLPRYQTTIESKIGSLREGTLGKLPGLLKDFGRRFDKAVAEPPPEQAPGLDHRAAAPPAPQEAGPLPVEVHEPDPTPLRWPGTSCCPCLSRWPPRASSSWC